MSVRRPRRALVVITVTLCLLAGVSTYVVSRRSGAACVDDPVAARALSDLTQYTRWLRANHARGYIGEVGWPSGKDSAQWNEVAERWFDTADRNGLWVTAWSAGQWWPRSYRMAVYRLGGTGTRPASSSQASVLQAHSHVPGALRGVDLPSGGFASGPEGPPDYSGLRPGRLGTDYYYEGTTDLKQVAAAGAGVVRMAVTWERLQHQVGGPLDRREVRRVKAALGAASSAGLPVIVDVHGYGDYWTASHRADGTAAPLQPGRRGRHVRLRLGSPRLTDADFADLWRRLSRALGSSQELLGYGLMNEPVDLSSNPALGAARWQAASQAAVRAIRSTGDPHTVFVSGYGGASPVEWTRWQPRAWIDDPLDQVRYEAHQYFDSDRSGRYRYSFRRESRVARAEGFDTVCRSTSVVADPE